MSSQWRGLTAQQRLAWAVAAAACYTINPAGQRVALNGYNYYMKVNASRAAKGLSLFPLPPASVPSFSVNPVAELVITGTGDNQRLKLRVLGLLAQHTLVQAAAPVSAGVRCVQHFPFVGFLPPPVDGWSDITDLVVGRYGRLTPGTVLFIRTCQHIDGWTDLPKEVSAVVPAA